MEKLLATKKRKGDNHGIDFFKALKASEFYQKEKPTFLY